MTRKLTSEFIGTFFLLLIVVGSGIMGQNLSQDIGVTLLANSLATAFGLIVLIWIFSQHSGAHFNPAVSLIMYLQDEISRRDLFLFIPVQTAGGILGVLAANYIYGLEVIQLSEKDRFSQEIFVSEIIATFGLLLTILSIGKHKKDFVALSVGLYIGAAYWFTASTSFANPAVSVARIFTNTFTGIAYQDVIFFIIAQFIGAILAWAVCKFIFDK
jgi:glycerol uptake facilitator-like aquaporin